MLRAMKSDILQQLDSRVHTIHNEHCSTLWGKMHLVKMQLLKQIIQTDRLSALSENYLINFSKTYLPKFYF